MGHTDGAMHICRVSFVADDKYANGTPLEAEHDK